MREDDTHGHSANRSPLNVANMRPYLGPGCLERLMCIDVFGAEGRSHGY